MSTSVESFPATTAQHSSASRVVSIDILRGLTMIVMIFVNDLASVHGLPWWNYHMPANIDAMTYVDMVFPLFLFMVGMSMPLAIKSRLQKNSSVASLWGHVLLRVLSLLVMGLIIANAEKGDSHRMGINTNLWGVLGLLGAALFWSIYPGMKERPVLRRALRITGAGLMIAMFVIFRRTTESGNAAWIDPSYPEILGLIAFAYLSACILYIPTRRWVWASLLWFVALTAMCSIFIAWHLQILRHVPLYFWPFGKGSMPSIVMAGVFTSSIFLDERIAQTPRKKMLYALLFGILTLASGWLLTPLGISKIRATPTWCLYSIGAGVLLFTALYWLCDVRKQTSWVFFARPAGSNTLLTYLLPDLYYFAVAALSFTYLEKHFGYGWPGVIRSVLFTMCILAISAFITRKKIRMQL